jgi:DNA-binding NarL/FixJ family response regulator
MEHNMKDLHSTPETVTVLLADDQPQVRSALRLLLEHEPGVTVVGEVGDAGTLRETMGPGCPNLVLLDWELPGMAGADTVRMLRSGCQEQGIIVLSGRPEACQPALVSGADYFVSKADPPEKLLTVLHRWMHEMGKTQEK